MSLICIVCFYFWCTNSVQSTCLTNSGNVPSSGVQIVFFENEYNLNMSLNLTGIPHNAKNYEIWMCGANTDGLYNISLKQSTISTFITFEKDLREYYISSDIIIKLYTRNKKELICDYQLPFMLLAHRQKSKASKHPCVSSGGCTHNISITCYNVIYSGSTPPPVTTTIEKNFHDVTFRLTSGDKSEETEVISKSEGEKITLLCQSDNPEMFLKWVHIKENGEKLSEITGNDNHDLDVELTIHLFDNNTKLICYAYPSNGNYEVVASSKVTKIRVLDRPMSKNYRTKSTHNEGLENHNISACLKQIITLNCHEHINKSPVTSIYWLEQRWDDYTNKYNDKYSFQISKEHMNSQFICLAYLGQDKNQLWKRKIQRIQTFHFSSKDECETVISPQSSTISPTDEISVDNGQPIIYGLVAGAVMILISALLFGYYWFHRKNQSNPHEVETYATLRVQYADLAILGSNTTRTVQREESPYAEIIGFLEPKNK